MAASCQTTLITFLEGNNVTTPEVARGSVVTTTNVSTQSGKFQCQWKAVYSLALIVNAKKIAATSRLFMGKSGYLR